MEQPEKKSYEIVYADMVAFDNDLVEGFRVKWGAVGVGFGQFDFFYKKAEDKLDEHGEPIPESRKLYCDNEFMSKDFIRAVLDKVLDNAVFLDGYNE